MSGHYLLLSLLLAALVAPLATANPLGVFQDKQAAQAAFADVEAALAAKGDAALADLYAQWKGQNHKASISSSQDRARRRLFAKRVKEVIAHNKDPATTWVASLNQFSASTKDELRGMLGLLPPPRAGASADRKLLMLGAEPEPELEAPGRRLLAVPSNFSWVDKGKVTSVKNQGSCGSCWAFAATGAIESWALIKNPTLNKTSAAVDLSEQQVVNCAITNGCNGGGLSSGLFYASRVSMRTEAQIPYKSGGTRVAAACSIGAATTAPPVVQLPAPGYAYVPFTYSGGRNWVNAATLMQYVSTKGPVVIGYAVAASFYSYSGGIYTETNKKCSSPNILGYHAVLIVGYNAVNGDPNNPGSYWLVKNSWGPNWGGLGGYFKVAMKGPADAPANGVCHWYDCTTGPPVYPSGL